MTIKNHFLEGGDAYRAWVLNGCSDEMPEPPYPEHTPSCRDWMVGFDDAMEYELHGQFEDDSTDIDE